MNFILCWNVYIEDLSSFFQSVNVKCGRHIKWDAGNPFKSICRSRKFIIVKIYPLYCCWFECTFSSVNENVDMTQMQWKPLKMQSYSSNLNWNTLCSYPETLSPYCGSYSVIFANWHSSPSKAWGLRGSTWCSDFTYSKAVLVLVHFQQKLKLAYSEL